MTRKQFEKKVRGCLIGEALSAVAVLIGIVIFVLYCCRGIVGPSIVQGMVNECQTLKEQIILSIDTIIHMGIFVSPIVIVFGVLGFFEERSNLQELYSRR